MPDDPSGGPPSVFKPATFARHADAVEYVEGLTRTRAPRPGTERFPGLAPGAWGLLAAGGVITGATGTRLGTGTVTLCDRDGVPLEDSPLNVYNAGAEIAAGTPYDDPYGYYDDSYDSGDRIVALEWVGGYWTACGCAGVVHDHRPCFICVAVTSGCGVVFPAGAIVTATIGSDTYHCTVDGTGHCCMEVTASGSGTYSVSVVKAPYSGSSKDVGVTCPGTTDVALTLSDASKGGRITVNGCPGVGGVVQPLPGARVTVNGGTYVTGPSGQVDFSAPPGTYPYTVSADRFVSQSGSITINCSFLAQAAKTLTPAAGYHCSLCGCVYPLKDTLVFTDSVLGAASLNFSGSIWQGTITYNYPGYCGCPARTAVAVDFECDGCNIRFRYKNTTIGSSTTCPDPTGFATFTVWYPISLTCPIPGAYLATGSPLATDIGGCAGGPPVRCVKLCLYQGTVPVWTVTE